MVQQDTSSIWRDEQRHRNFRDKAKVVFSYFSKRLCVSLFILFFSSYSYAQFMLPEFFPGARFIGYSNSNNKNINHSDGAEFQDLKRATGIMILSDVSVEGFCSCTLMNGALQDGKILLLTAAHCIPGRDAGSDVALILSFNYEHPDALARGSEVADVYITRAFVVDGTAQLVDRETDIALIELHKEGSDEWYENVYASGWNASLTHDPLGNISHPLRDHKKLFLSPEVSELTETMFLASNGQIREGHFYRTKGTWDGRDTYPQKGASGSGLFDKEGNLMAVSSAGNSQSQLFSAISNNWFDSNNGPTLRAFLDPDGKWLNAVPGGYLSDLMLSGSDFELQVKSEDVFSTPGIAPGDRSMLMEKVINLRPLFLLDDIDINEDTDVEDILGIKIDDPNTSAIELTLHALLKSEDSGDYYEKLVYGSQVDQNAEEGIDGFKQTNWQCGSNLNQFKPCDRENDTNWWPFQNALGSSVDFLPSFVRSWVVGTREAGQIQSIRDAKIPVVARLQNLGTESVKVQAVSYPGDVPQNALQLFKPEEVAQAFKSYKYPESRSLSSDDLFIDQINLSQVPVFPNIRKTGNNGGYLNLVNPNFKIDLVTGASTTMDLNVENPNSLTYSYSAWIDYFNSETLNGKNKEEITYNFVDDPMPHPQERIAQGTSSSNMESMSFDVPSHWELQMAVGEKRLTRMRVSISEGSNSPQPDQPIVEGEVEDYLIELQTPTCELLRPDDYTTYAKDVMPYCGDDGYLPRKEPLTNYYQVEPGDELTFKTGKLANVHFASAKATRSWYTGAANVLIDNRVSPVPDPSAPGFDQSLSAISTNDQESDPNLLIDQDLKMDIYYPLTKDGVGLDELAALPVIIYHFGGAFIWNTRQSQLTQKTCEWLASRGNIVAAIDYRVGLYGYEQKVALRTMVRAWQDSRTATKWWRMSQNAHKVNDQFQVQWKADQTRVYAMGHSAGGITSQTNLFLTEVKYDVERGEGKLLEATRSGYGYGGLDDSGNPHYLTYDLRNYEPIPCLEIMGVNTCDVLSKGTDGSYGTYQGGSTELTPLIGQLLDEYRSVDGRVDKAVSFAGAIAKTDWMLTPSHRPSAEIHHRDDAVVPWGHDFPFNGFNLPWGSLINLLPQMSLSKVHGGGSMKEAWDNATVPINGTFELLTLIGPNEGGMNGQASYHLPQYKFESNYDDYLSGGAPEIEDKIMYYVDAFFTKDWGTADALRQNLEVAEESSQEVLPEKEMSSQQFTVFPNPASDEVNVIVDIPRSGSLDLQIIDLQGKMVYQIQEQHVQEGTQWVRLSNLNLPSGTYVLQLFTNSVVRSERLIIR